MLRVFLIINFCCLLLFEHGMALAAQSEEPAPRETVRLKALQGKEASESTSSQGQEYHVEKIFLTKDFFSQQQSHSPSLSTSSYSTRSFLGILNPWLGRKDFVTKKVFSGSKQNTALQEKTFSIQELSTRAYHQALRSENVMSKKFPTSTIQLDPKAQGSLDRDQQLQQALKKSRSIDEVRALLDKGI